ncbi:MAG: addiction module protein [Verrucomicrobiota bacterium]
MSATVAHLLSQALRLTADSRTELVEAILEQTHPSREFIARQMDLVESRREEVKAGTSTLIPAGEAHAIVLESLQARP